MTGKTGLIFHKFCKSNRYTYIYGDQVNKHSRPESTFLQFATHKL